MQNRTVPLSLLTLPLLISAAITLPSLAIAAPMLPTADNTLQAEIEGSDGELLATQPGYVDSDEAEELSEVDGLEDDAPELGESSLNRPSSTSNSRSASGRRNGASLADRLAMSAASTATAQNVDSDSERSLGAPSRLQQKKKDSRGELLATQPAQVELNENRRMVVR